MIDATLPKPEKRGPYATHSNASAGVPMPQTDYADPETAFPRLEARVHKTDDDAFSIRIWRWEKPGDGRRGERRQIMTGMRAGSYDEATQMIYDCAREEDVIVEPDDISVE